MRGCPVLLIAAIVAAIIVTTGTQQAPTTTLATTTTQQLPATAAPTTTQGLVATAAQPTPQAATTTLATTTTTTLPQLVEPIPLLAPIVGGEFLEAGSGCPGQGLYPTADRFHLGVDVPAAQGAAVKAIANGVVTYIGTSGWAADNIALVIVHDDGATGYFSAVYARLARAPSTMTVGDRVQRGQTIGWVGFSTHLHIGIHPGAQDIDRSFGLGQARCAVWWVDRNQDGRPDNTNGFVDPFDFLAG